MLSIGSLCTGYGGADSAAQAVFGGELRFVADIDPAACTLLEYRYPGVPNLGDITQVAWEPRSVDVLTAGFPCQPISDAGRRLGVDDERWLWPEVARAVRTIRPRLVVLENVAAILGRGLGEVLRGLAAAGYVGSYCCLRASDVGAPHERERWFAVAYPSGERLERHPRQERAVFEPAEGDSDPVFGIHVEALRHWARIVGRSAPSPVVQSSRGNNRLNPVFSEWMMGLPEGWVTGVPGLDYAGQLHLLGNGVVPQQFEFAVRSLTNRS